MAVLDRPRHGALIDEIRTAGAGTRMLLDGDVAGGINAARSETRIDMCVGTGGSPEGVVTACAIKALGGCIQGRLAPKDEAGAERGRAAGLDVDKIYSTNELVASDNTMFVATGVTDGGLLEGVRRKGPTATTTAGTASTAAIDIEADSAEAKGPSRHGQNRERCSSGSSCSPSRSRKGLATTGSASRR